MSKPNVPALLADLEVFDQGPLAFDLDECKALRQRIYHALYYDDQGWHKLDFVVHVHLARMLARIRGIEDSVRDAMREYLRD